MNFKSKNLVIGGVVGGLSLAALSAYFYFRSQPPVSDASKPTESAALDNSALNASADIVLNPDEVKIVEENDILTGETMRELLSLNLKTIQEEFIEILQRHREQRRRVFDDADKYGQGVQEYYDALGEVLKEHLKTLLAVNHISKHKWTESLKYHVADRNKLVLLVLEKYDEILKSKLQPKAKVTVAVYKEILKSVVKELTSERKDEEWKPVVKLRVNLGLIGWSRAWDKVHKSFGYEEEDVMNVDHIKADDEIPMLMARLENTREKFISEFGDVLPLEMWTESP